MRDSSRLCPIYCPVYPWWIDLGSALTNKNRTNPSHYIMQMNKQLKTTMSLAAFAGLTLAGSVNAAVIYSDNFDGVVGDVLNGTTPDVTTGGATWTAAAVFKADGSFVNGNHSLMTLAFTPDDGLVYTLDASIALTEGDDWSTFGFGDGGSDIQVLYHQIRNPGAGEHRTKGTGINIVYATGTTLDSAHPLDVRILLDTTAGKNIATVTWYAKLPASGAYTLLYTAPNFNASSITTVGWEARGSTTDGTIDNFSLSDNTAVPEPTTTALLGLGGLALILRRRK